MTLRKQTCIQLYRQKLPISKSPFLKHFIHLAPQLRVGCQFSTMFALAKSHDSEKADMYSTLPPKASDRKKPVFKALYSPSPPTQGWLPVFDYVCLGKEP